MASVGDFVSDVTSREHEELSKALREGESIRWAVRPLVKRGVKEVLDYILLELFALCWLAFFCWGTCGFLAALERVTFSALLVAFALLLFLAMGIFLALTPWRRRYRRAHTLYVVTNHRALISTPGYFSWSLHAFPLWEHVVRFSIARPAGGGDLIFTDDYPHKGAYDNFEHGFTYLPDLQCARRELNAAVDALLDAAERHLGSRAQNS